MKWHQMNRQTQQRLKRKKVVRSPIQCLKAEQVLFVNKKLVSFCVHLLATKCLDVFSQDWKHVQSLANDACCRFHECTIHQHHRSTHCSAREFGFSACFSLCSTVFHSIEQN